MVAERTLRVLLIEDNDDQAMLVERQLKRVDRNSIQLTRVDRLSAGLQALQTQPFDAVLLDLNLPDSRGLSTCYRLCECAPDVPVIAMTAADMLADGVRLVREKAEDFLPKIGLDAQVMVRAIYCAVERAERRRAQAQLYHAAGQLEAARRIQTALLPKESPRVDGFEMAGISEPAEAVGGDYFDFLSSPEGRLLVAVGDVEGHGPAAAMMMAVAAGSVRTAFELGDDSGRVLTRVNSVLEHFPPRNTMMTMLLVEPDAETKTLRYATAAHPHGYLLGADGTLKLRLNVGNDIPLGVMANHKYTCSETISLSPGDMILIVSDGVLECGVSRQQKFGEQRLLRAVMQNFDASPAAIVSGVLTAANDFREGQPAEDDITVVLVRADSS